MKKKSSGEQNKQDFNRFSDEEEMRFFSVPEEEDEEKYYSDAPRGFLKNVTDTFPQKVEMEMNDQLKRPENFQVAVVPTFASGRYSKIQEDIFVKPKKTFRSSRKVPFSDGVIIQKRLTFSKKEELEDEVLRGSLVSVEQPKEAVSLEESFSPPRGLACLSPSEPDLEAQNGTDMLAPYEQADEEKEFLGETSSRWGYAHLGQSFETPPEQYFPIAEDFFEKEVSRDFFYEPEKIEENKSFSWVKDFGQTLKKFFSAKKHQIVSLKKPEDLTGSPKWEEKSLGLKKMRAFFSSWKSILESGLPSASNPRFAYSYVFLGGAILLGFGVLSFTVKGLALQGSVLGVSERGVSSALSAVESLKKQEFSVSSEQFDQASQSFRTASQEMSDWAGILSRVSLPIPFLSKLSSAQFALDAGEHLANGGKFLGELAELATKIKNPLKEKEGISLLEVFRDGLELSEKARAELAIAQENLDKVRLSDIPKDKRDQFAQLKNILPTVLTGLESAESNAPAFTDVLGGNGPRKYLFLFQNNHEARATGGFIGSYGLLDMKDGSVRDFFINGIFDPDGQLKVDIVPPQPIRKVSAAWSLHDSNWFADFPTSAEKAIFFYEKTGGATVDGVITITPTVLQRLLEATGPVYLSEYDVTVTADNVIQTLQYKVEKDYDKEENKPKKILGDLAPILLERVFHMKDVKSVSSIVNAIHASLREKDILLYSRNATLQAMYQEMGWSGELRETSNDFLSVVNSNVNGFKTDGVIEQTVRHNAQIQSDGTIVDTVTITRKHNGGDTPYEWWNAVNADYMRVYVPKGSVLISASGQTRETVKDPLDYNALEFQRDDLVSSIEQNTHTDSASGTQIFEESGKTVFGNWVYVSPKESVTVEYAYQLPFRAESDTKNIAFYSLLTQKQSGSLPSIFSASIQYPEEWNVSWSSPDRLQSTAGSMSFEGELATDLFQGFVFEKK